MAQVDLKNREIAIKLVYYGPALSGKTTNLEQIHARLDPDRRARLLKLDTKDDRTLYFDLLPLRVQSATGLTAKIKLFTVPGQVLHNATRKLVLQGVDGVAFVADSQVAETRNNNESFANLRQNLNEIGIDPDGVPTVIQFNKRDLPRVRSEDEIRKIATRGKEPIFLAAAIRGEGVIETLLGLVGVTYDALDRSMGLGERHGLKREQVIADLERQLSVKGAEAE